MQAALGVYPGARAAKRLSSLDSEDCDIHMGRSKCAHKAELADH